MTAAHWLLGGAGAFFAIAGIIFLLRTVEGSRTPAGDRQTIDLFFLSLPIGSVSVSVGTLLLILSAVIFYFGVPALEQAQRTSRIETLENNLRDANGTIEERDKKIGELEEDLSSKDQKIGDLNTSIGQKDVEISGLKAKTRRQEKEIERKAQTITVKDQEIDDLKDLVRTRDRALERNKTQIMSLRTDLQDAKKEARNAMQVARDIASAENEADLSAGEREELRRVREGIDQINSELDRLALREAPLLEIVGQPAVANYEIYARSLASSDEDALDRGFGLLAFESERFTVENYYSEGEIERLLAEIGPALCGAVNASIADDISIHDAIRRIPSLEKYEGVPEPIRVIAESAYLQLQLQALAIEAKVFVRGYADGERAGWSRPLPLDTPRQLEAHPLANPDLISPLANWRFLAETEPRDIGDDNGEYANADLPNLRGFATLELMSEAVSGCALPGQEPGGLDPQIEILDGKLYGSHTGTDRKARAFVSISLR